MTLSRLEEEKAYHENISQLMQPILPQLDKLVKYYVLIHLLFIFAIALESVLLLAFFSFLANSSFLAFGLAALFLTIFSYLLIRLYFQTAKPERLIQIRSQFVNSCKTVLNYSENSPADLMALAQACSKLSFSLQGKERNYYRPPEWLIFLTPWFEKFSAWWHWQDIHRVRELLLLQTIEQHILLVKSEPISMEIHAALANAYINLASLYQEPLKAHDQDKWLLLDKYFQNLPEKFRKSAEKAIEEFKIINDFAPNDPWVHEQLAYTYHDLDLTEEEIKEYETLIHLNPEDKEAQYKLGALYFAVGMNSKGLRVYQELRKSHAKKADSLIKLYR